MQEIKSRDEVNKLVRLFYSQVREDDLLGEVFNITFTTEKVWEIHYDLLVDFWMFKLFNERNFKGNPQKVHQHVDKKMGYGMSPKHFERWADIWCSVVDTHFAGEKADLAKQEARNMAIGMYGKVLKGRPGNGTVMGKGFAFLGKKKES